MPRFRAPTTGLQFLCPKVEASGERRLGSRRVRESLSLQGGQIHRYHFNDGPDDYQRPGRPGATHPP